MYTRQFLTGYLVKNSVQLLLTIRQRFVSSRRCVWQRTELVVIKILMLTGGVRVLYQTRLHEDS